MGGVRGTVRVRVRVRVRVGGLEQHVLLALAVRLAEEGVECHEGEDGVHAWVGVGVGCG